MNSTVCLKFWIGSKASLSLHVLQLSRTKPWRLGTKPILGNLRAPGRQGWGTRASGGGVKGVRGRGTRASGGGGQGRQGERDKGVRGRGARTSGGGDKGVRGEGDKDVKGEGRRKGNGIFVCITL